MKAEPNASTSTQTAKNETGDFAQFTDFMRQLVSVPRSVVQQRLEEEKRFKNSRASLGSVFGRPARRGAGKPVSQ